MQRMPRKIHHGCPVQSLLTPGDRPAAKDRDDVSLAVDTLNNLYKIRWPATFSFGADGGRLQRKRLATYRQLVFRFT